jgi:hypothetical protein
MAHTRLLCVRPHLRCNALEDPVVADGFEGRHSAPQLLQDEISAGGLQSVYSRHNVLRLLAIDLLHPTLRAVNKCGPLPTLSGNRPQTADSASGGFVYQIPPLPVKPAVIRVAFPFSGADCVQLV